MKKLASTLPNMLLSLTGICILVAAILGGMHQLTAKPIAEAKMNAKTSAIKAVTPAFDNNPSEARMSVLLEGDADSVYLYPATKDGAPVGYAVETYTNNGFSGRFTVMVGFDAEGKVVDYTILQHAETPGLGSKMQEWFHQPSKTGNIQDLRGVNMKEEKALSVSKDGGRLDAITAATISSRGFADAINRAYNAFLKVQEGGNE
ncbi:electron transporter RnfG [Porphyromonas macacae]|uniref:Ion-translocating oxidoreductase complex subunit G n=1 Tax=Porphyromonas macacae TaxID=28115 RepID=A0A0A2E9R0_9PORP|nr:RnfABCDGE type electron transport complex subunit G [Porphyromonas macacae]KGN75643.1 electron transporter RnfG [Porphyromonas macacae]